MDDLKGQGRAPSSVNTRHRDPCAELGASAICALIDEWIVGAYAYRDRYILKKRLVDGMPYCMLMDAVEEEYGVPLSERQLRRIVAAGIKQLKKHGL